VHLSRNEYIGDHVAVFLNRLSDLLFAMARRANQLEGVEDVPWIGRRDT
jgi:cob(I)alamin adenosyltransferase